MRINRRLRGTVADRPIDSCVEQDIVRSKPRLNELVDRLRTPTFTPTRLDIPYNNNALSSMDNILSMHDESDSELPLSKIPVYEKGLAQRAVSKFDHKN